jgi:hypothetical protein
MEGNYFVQLVTYLNRIYLKIGKIYGSEGKHNMPTNCLYSKCLICYFASFILFSIMIPSIA